MKKTLRLMAFIAGMALFCACSEDSNLNPQSSNPTIQSLTNKGVVVLNTGNIYSGIEGDISNLYYCCETTRTDSLPDAQMANNIFSSINRRSLGATPNDLLRYGSRIYAAVDGSNTIEVMDAGHEPFKSIKQITFAGNDSLNEPRRLTAYEGKVYVSFISGHVARLDTASLNIEKVMNLGAGTCPEGLAASNGKLYVATSGDWNTGYLSTVACIDLTTFQQTTTLPCGLNPTEIKVDADGKVYVLCTGDYGATKSAIYLLGDAAPEKLCEATLFDIPQGGRTLYAINCAWDVYPISYFQMDLTTKQQTVLPISVTYPAAIAYDATLNYIIVTSFYMGGYGYPSYSTSGYLSVFSTAGKELTRKDVGVGPTRIVFL